MTSEAEQRLVEAMHKAPDEEFMEAGFCALYRELAAMIERRSDAGAVPEGWEAAAWTRGKFRITRDNLGLYDVYLNGFFITDTDNLAAAIAACQERTR